MSNDKLDIVEKAEQKATEPYDKILAEYKRLSETAHDVRRNVNFIISDMVAKMEDTPENHIIGTTLENANSLLTNNSNLLDVITIVREIGYNMKVKARTKARLDLYNASEVGKNAREFMEKTKTE